MKTQFLFPHRYRLIGWVIFIPSVILGLSCLYSDFKVDFLTLGAYQSIVIKSPGGSLEESINLTDELASLGVIAGLLMIGFSKEKVEDEMIGKLRLDALQWSIYVNYVVLAVAILLVHGSEFLTVMIYNMFTVLLVFVVRFRWLVGRNTKALRALAL